MSQKKKRRSARKAEPSLPRQLREGILQAGELFRRKQYDLAHQLLEELDRRFPRRPEVLGLLGEVSVEQGDLHTYLRAAEGLAELLPGKADVTLMLAGAYLANCRAFQALKVFRRFLDRWPDHPRAADARKTLADLEAGTRQLLAEPGLSDDEGRELGLLQDETLSLLERGRYAEARRAAEDILKRRPDFVPALNNLGEAYFRDGHAEQGIATARRVLALAPDNVHAQSNLTRYLFLSGRGKEARAEAERLKALRSDAPDLWVKQAEALALLGDDPGVLDALGRAEQAGRLGTNPHDGMLYHLAAVAAYRTGQVKTAERYWAKSLEQDPGLAPARDNRTDLDQPPEQRHAPWPFPFTSWIPRATVDGLADSLAPTARRKDETAVTRRVRDSLGRHPELVALVSALLDRGDPAGRTFALGLARMAETPELLEALRGFALGQRGPDAQRMEAAEAATRAGLLPSGEKVRMWIRGEWTDILQFGFELHGEPIHPHSPRVEPLARAAMDAIHQGDGVKGERLLRQALEIEPDSPALLNNLSTAYQAQGRGEEGMALTRELHRRFPDYLFARTNLAIHYSGEGRIEEARALLQPLLSRRRLHFSEFSALCAAEIQVALADGNRDAARTWFDLWQRGVPDHPQQEILRREIEGRSWFPRGWGRRR